MCELFHTSNHHYFDGNNKGRLYQCAEHRVEAARLALPLRPVEGLAQDEEPGGTGGEARGRAGLGAMSKRKLKPWMRVEQAIIWSVAVIASLMVAAGIAYRALL